MLVLYDAWLGFAWNQTIIHPKHVNSLPPGRCAKVLEYITDYWFLKLYHMHLLLICTGMGISDCMSTLVQVMAWCRQAQQAFIWAILDQYPCHHMASLRGNEFEVNNFCTHVMYDRYGVSILDVDGLVLSAIPSATTTLYKPLLHPMSIRW